MREKIRKNSTRVQGIVMWTLFLLLIAFMLAGTFLFLLKITKHFFMENISWSTVPWIYLGLYATSIACVYTIVLFVKKLIVTIKRKRSIR